MKKRLFSMFMASFFAILSGSFVSCSESDEVETQNTLKVTPSSAISFAADGNQDVVLTVETDAGAWAFEEAPGLPLRVTVTS